jgi:hypothetical protein
MPDDTNARSTIIAGLGFGLPLAILLPLGPVGPAVLSLLLLAHGCLSLWEHVLRVRSLNTEVERSKSEARRGQRVADAEALALIAKHESDESRTRTRLEVIYPEAATQRAKDKFEQAVYGAATVALASERPADHVGHAALGAALGIIGSRADGSLSRDELNLPAGAETAP